MSSSSSSGSSIGFPGALTLLFIGLKLTHVIDWPWWIVLSPAWGSVVLFLFILVFIVLVKILLED